MKITSNNYNLFSEDERTQIKGFFKNRDKNTELEAVFVGISYLDYYRLIKKIKEIKNKGK
jgi:hypothetical protein